MKKIITIIDIARISKFSKSTVSKVLRDEPNVKASTRKKIQKIIDEQDYQPNEIARYLVLRKTTNFLGLIVPDINNPFYSELALGVECAAKKYQCNTILCNTNYDRKEEDKYINILLRNRALGMVITSPRIDEIKNIKYLLDRRYPFVLVSRKVEGIKTNFIAVDYLKATKMAINYLIKKNHRKIAFFTGNQNSFGMIKRLQGYKQVLKENNIEINNNFIMENDISIQGGYCSAEKLLKMEEKPTAIFAANDLVAIGAIDCIIKNGYYVPKDFSIIGFDNIDITSLNSINLTTVNQPKFELGSEAVEILFNQIKNQNLKPITRYLKADLIERGSVAILNEGLFK